ncbi:MAG: tRNA methyl transferase PRC-barrel domain-containing protein [Rikenellaceae bacterium]
MDRNRVVLGYSGGVDSAAAVSILQQQHLEVTALTLDMCGDDKMVNSARQSALSQHIEFVSLNCEELFNREIKDYFINEYLSGRTPAPCTRCNPMIKWRLLLDYANSNNIYHIATGHYFRIEEYNGKLYVAKAKDSRKDQSYYLWGLSQEVLSRAITPMAEVIKEEINREKKRESMGVCFLNGRRYSDYISEICGEIAKGDIVDKNGNICGQHKGLAHYTVGQKRGEGIPVSSLIIGLDNARNHLIIGTDSDLYHSQLYISQCNIVDQQEFIESKDISVMIRGIGRNPEGFASKIEKDNKGYKITLSSPAWACAAGQPVVFYRGGRVIGGGYLDSSQR